ncbi:MULTISPECIES: aminodeoxychorismate lyase [unclassified Halomonas]|uniref:aminodeoxychorismate lyase n=1 Tax=unclassified Halomonas TaxID=2609666 RepID=UPI00209CF48C|nr:MULTISPECIES: aminodeoxychorismate lyase [unclassified Halomonas]MCP1315574.1 aminodeoxychorismate lyase [Halomonas sp. 707D7]MCP1325685.1 aminodeoxychorismate lyase [Halomonas sp. 707D4]
MPGASVPADDRGLAYGDGLFETVLMRAGQPLLWSYHRARLAEGCRRLGIPMPDTAALDAELARPGAAALEVLKLIVTRGSGGQGYRVPNAPAPRLLASRRAFEPCRARWQEGVCVRVCDLRLGHQPRLAGIKHLNRLENVLARQEWCDPGIAEGLLADADGLLVEATSMNVFWRAKGRLWTPPVTRCGVAGTLRAALLDAGAVAEAELSLEALVEVDALWVANSVQGVWPVHTLLDPRGETLATWAHADHDTLQRQGHRLLGYPGSFREEAE